MTGGGPAPGIHAFSWPERASTVASRVDGATAGLLVASALLIVILVGLNFYFIVRYRRGSSAPRPPLGIAPSKVEALWIGATTLAFLGFFFWGARIFLDEETAPPGAEEIDVTARQWMWDIRQPNGRREFNELHVPVGVPVRLILASEDVIHSFFVPAFRLKQDVVPGRQVSLWFQATKAGSFALFCSEFCGTQHAAMIGAIVAQAPTDYSAWLAHGAPAEQGTERGRMLFVRYGCSGCHSPGSSVHAPRLEGIYGQQVPVTGGGFARVDDAYLRDCILLPGKIAPAGYPLVMPSFQGVVPEGDLLELIAYIKSLRPPNP